MVIKINRIKQYNIETPTYVEVDKIIAIEDIKYISELRASSFASHHSTFTIYFDNDSWEVDSSCYEKLLRNWLIVKNKSFKVIDLCTN